MASGTIRRYLSALGDTMTGDLTVDSASAVVKDGRVESGTTPGSNIYGRAFYLFDKNGVNVGTFQIMSLANGREGFQLVANKKVGNVNKNNYLRMNVDSNGDPVIDLSSPAAWRSALGIGVEFVSSGSMHSVATSGIYYIGNSVTDKPSTYGGMLIFAAANSTTKCGLYVTNTSNPQVYVVTVVGGTWAYTLI